MATIGHPDAGRPADVRMTTAIDRGFASNQMLPIYFRNGRVRRKMWARRAWGDCASLVRVARWSALIMAYLQWLEGIEPGKRLELDSERAVMGRSSECDLPLVSAAAVSRRHVEFTIDDGRHYVEDLGSRNGHVGQRSADRRQDVAGQR